VEDGVPTIAAVVAYGAVRGTKVTRLRINSRTALRIQVARAADTEPDLQQLPRHNVEGLDQYLTAFAPVAGITQVV
jgi:hypothetical protein